MAAASVLIRPVLLGPDRRATVLAALPAAVYLRLDDEPDEGPEELVAVLARDAARLPIGLVTAAAAADRPFAAVTAGAPVAVGAGRIQLAGREYRPLRWWDPTVPVLGGQTGQRPDWHDPLRSRDLVELLAGPGAALADALDRAPADAPEHHDGDLLAAAVHGLVGLGPGLTPAGDDLLCGALVGLRAAGHAAPFDALAAPVRALAGRTNPISAALLRCACRGAAVPQLAGLVTALLRARPAAEVRAAAAELTRVGHSSGAALAAGALLGLGCAGASRAGRSSEPGRVAA